MLSGQPDVFVLPAIVLLTRRVGNVSREAPVGT
jgi:hypothetical protein